MYREGIAMKRPNVFLIVTGLVSLAANVLTILSYFSNEEFAAVWKLDRGLLVALTFILMAYALVVWSALVWRWASRFGQGKRPRSRNPATFLLNGLVSFPLWTIWLYMLFSVVLFSQVASNERWVLAMGFAWGLTPFATLGLMAMGETLGPLIAGVK
jgi:hypothetical protein